LIGKSLQTGLLQDLADRLDPVLVTAFIDEGIDV